MFGLFDDDPQEGARWWDGETEPENLLECRLSEDGWSPWRKLHLFSCACCRRHWEHIEFSRSRDLLEMIERFADEKVSQKELEAARACLGEFRHEWADEAIWRAADTENGDFHLSVMYGLRVWSADKEAETAAHARMLREVLGNPFRPAIIDQSWLAWHDGLVPALAQAAYDDRELPGGDLKADKLAILADALEEAGCTNADMLSHLRGRGPHVRGCWVVDLLLGKE